MQAALVPKIVEPTLNAHRRDIAIPNLAIIADRLDDVDHEAVIEAERLTQIAFYSEQAAYVGNIGVLRHIVHVLLCDSGLLRREQGEEDPPSDVEELVVALADHNAERLLADHFRQKQ